MSAIVNAPMALRRIVISSAFVFCSSSLAWPQKVDLEAVGISIVPTSTPGVYDITPVMAGQVSETVDKLKIPYHVTVGGKVVESWVITLLYPTSEKCVAPPPFHCGGTCSVMLKLSSNTPFVTVAGDCVASLGCWCSFPPTDLRTFPARVKCVDMALEDVTLVLDPLDTIEELDESNNTWTLPRMACPPPPGGGGGIDPCEESQREPQSRNARVRSPSSARSSVRSNLSKLPVNPMPARSPRPMVYDWARQRVERRGVPQKRFSSAYCYVNTDTVGFFTSTTLGTEFLDWGILGGTATTKCCEMSDIVSGFRFAYATSTLDTSVAGPGAALTLTFYTGFKGFCQDSGNCPVATFAFSGMPGYSGGSTGIGATYAFSVDLSGGFEFCMPDGRFGYGYRGDGNTGPLLCQTGDGAGGPEPCTGNLDVFDLWVPDVKTGICLGSFFFGGPPNDFNSWYGQIARAELSTPAAVITRNAAPNKAGSLACSPAVLGGTLDLTVLTPGKAAAVLFAFDTPITLPLSGGQVLLCIDAGSGELLTGGGLSALPTGGSVGGCPELAASAGVPKNLALCGLAFSVQAISFAPPPFALSNACDMTVGG